MCNNEIAVAVESAQKAGQLSIERTAEGKRECLIPRKLSRWDKPDISSWQAIHRLGFRIIRRRQDYSSSVNYQLRLLLDWLINLFGINPPLPAPRSMKDMSPHEQDDHVYYRVTMPEGWAIKSVNEYFSDILDDSGNEIGSIYTKHRFGWFQSSLKLKE